MQLRVFIKILKNQSISTNGILLIKMLIPSFLNYHEKTDKKIPFFEKRFLGQFSGYQIQ